jgi:NAD(P)H-hydrate epimerase
MQFVKSSPIDTEILILAENGGNGGGTMVAARHLSNKGFSVEIIFSEKIKTLDGAIKHQADILTKLPINIYEQELPKKIMI